MMKRVIIFDILGSHCGMHYYDIAFADILRDKGCEVNIISNFSENEESRPGLRQIFSCGKSRGLLRMLTAYWTFLTVVAKDKAHRIVYLTYGEIYELPFLLIAAFSPRIYVDVHEIHALKYNDSSAVSRLFEWIYSHMVHHVIYHSERTRQILGNYKIDMVYIPHFKYVFQKKYDYTKLHNDVKGCFTSDKVKFLFFGNLSTVKGIDTVTNLFSQLTDYKEKFELVIAGQNVENLDFSMFTSESIKIIDRHINDDELVYLYSSTDFVLLPYKKSSQSGIFAMAAYFHKPMILSDIPYFKSMIEKYPSFGICVQLEKYKNVIISILNKGTDSVYYTTADCDQFETKKDIDEFVKKFIGK